MPKRHIPKSAVDYVALKKRLMERYPQLPFSIQETTTEYVIRASDTNEGLEAHIGDLLNYASTPPYLAKVLEISANADRPLRLQRGNHVGWAYASPTTQDLITQNKIRVGQKVLVMFIEGDRGKPVVI